MPENYQANGDPNKADSNDAHAFKGDSLLKVYPIGKRVALVGGIMLGTLLLGSIFIPNMTERIKFFTVNALSVLVLLAIAVQAYIYRKQWEAMDTQAGTMQNQLKAMEDSLTETRKMVTHNERLTDASEAQKVAMQGQLVTIQEQATIMRDSLAETQNMLKQNERAVRASERQANTMISQASTMQDQTATMQENLTVTRNMVEQNERAVKAAEQSAKVAEEALYIGEAPYFGIAGMAILDLEVGYCPKVQITFWNGGKTPAWNFHALVAIVLDYRPDSEKRWWVRQELGDLGFTFFPPGEQKTIEYGRTDFRLTEAQDQALRDDHPQRLYVQGTAHYRDMRGNPLHYEFCGMYYPSNGKFGDYYAT